MIWYALYLLALTITGVRLQNVSSPFVDSDAENITVPAIPPADESIGIVLRDSVQQTVKFSTLKWKIAWFPSIKGSEESSHVQFSPGATPPGFASNQRYFLGIGSPNWAYPTCKQSNVMCRFIEHCPQARFLSSFKMFSDNSCKIGNDFIGVCCGAAIKPQISVTPSPPKDTSTQALPPGKSSTIGCGLHNKFEIKVVGGEKAEEDEWPWMAALIQDGNSQRCGGVLISNQHVLTAAHCFLENNSPQRWAVRLGEYNFNVRSFNELEIPVSRIIQHENYHRNLHHNDIAILKLSRPVTFNRQIRHICIPEVNSAVEGSFAYVTGWGSLCSGCESSNILMELRMPIWRQQKCSDTFSQFHRYSIQSTQMCAGFEAGKMDSCQGDSGGPLMVKREKEDRWYVEGIVSFGIGCARPNAPGVYTRVGPYINWIKSTVSSM